MEREDIRRKVKALVKDDDYIALYQWIIILREELSCNKKALRLACGKIEGLGEFKILLRLGIPATVISSDGNPVKSIKAIQDHFISQAKNSGTSAAKEKQKEGR
jgi:hypothetical protein